MEREICPEEARLMEAARLGRFNAELERHAAHCTSCSDALAIAQFLSEPDDSAVEVPGWGLVYWKSELRARREQSERALRPMQQMQMASIVAMVAIVIVVAALSGMEWVPAAAASFGAFLVAAVVVVRRMLLRDSQ